jgi:diaminopropionate ammonia-lyase
MDDGIAWVQNGGAWKSRCAQAFNCDKAYEVAAWHASFPEYAETPLVALNARAVDLGLGGVFVKDESYRFGLNAFKVLGGSYALGNYVARALGRDVADVPYPVVAGEGIRSQLGDVTFVTATDGNHGRGIAWTADRLHQKAVVYLPAGSSPERLDNIRALGADAFIVDMNYDGAVRLAASRQRERGWVLVQDTAWPGYEEIPTWIMQGYTTMALEAVRQLGDVRPTHVFLQAGVGAMSGAVTAFLASYYGADMPHVTIVEPNQADCVFRSAAAGDGNVRTVTGDMRTIMAGLACGEPCTIGWDVLRAYARHFVSMPDWVAAQGMRTLANPLGGDSRIVSGESGAATMGLVVEIMRNPALTSLREELGLGSDSVVLCFSTEGDTDRVSFHRIVDGGAHPRPASRD